MKPIIDEMEPPILPNSDSIPAIKTLEIQAGIYIKDKVDIEREPVYCRSCGKDISNGSEEVKDYQKIDFV